MSLIILALVLAADVPSWAASPPPPLPDSMQLTMDRYRNFSNCVATRDWQVIRPLFDTGIFSPEETRLLRIAGGRGRGTECATADYMRMSSMLMRGGIAESRYRHVYARAAVPPVNEEVAPAPAGTTFTWVGFNRDSHPQALFYFTTCLVERETGAVHALLMTAYGSREERTAFQALSRRFGACLRPGQHLQASPLTLRPWLAERQYQYVRARQPDSAN
jgi:hypothetical protein